MPHIIVEYSDNLSTLEMPVLLCQLHESLAGNGVDKARIKARAIKVHDYAVCTQGTAGEMVHATLLLLEGRDLDTRKKLSAPLYEILKKKIHAKYPGCAVTLEVREMNKDTYYM
jgi:5-carboxymethyl-2-hydroxymuconate isomerase